MNHHMNSSRIIPAAITALAILVAGCSAQSAPPNDADVEFLQGMIPHHGEAVEMAEMVAGATDRPELLELADAIVTTQSEEIGLMERLLTDSGADLPQDDMAGMDHGNAPMMGGMMTEEDMQALAGMGGTDFDLMFVDMMLDHHKGAVDAATSVLADGANLEVAQLATAIIAAQQNEIEQMTDWQNAWS